MPAGTGVRLALRIDWHARHLVRAVDVLLGERSSGGLDTTWKTFALHPSDEGFAGTVLPGAYPHASYYVFALHVEPEYGWIASSAGVEIHDDGGQVLYYVPRADGRSTSGDLMRNGEDGSWTGFGWSYSQEQASRRPVGDLALAELQPGFQITTYDPSFESPEWAEGPIMYQIFPDRFARGDLDSLKRGIEYHERMKRPYRLHDDWNDEVDWTGAVEEFEDGAQASDAVDEASGDVDEASDDATIAGFDDAANGDSPETRLQSQKQRAALEAEKARAAARLQAEMRAYDPVDFFGGSISGIIDAIPYLVSLGVEVLYLNPVFEARSNHRYDTADYERIDPILGSEEDFKLLVEKARNAGISIVLDAVLSHTGFDSRYFNGAGAYDEPGAAQGPASPFYDWFHFFERDGDLAYSCWWGDPTLPEVDERNGLWQRYVLGDASSKDGSFAGVLPKWLSEGVRGYRLDVADEVPDDVLEGIRESVKRTRPDGLIIGEVWEDPTTKTSYGSHRSFGLGRSLDSVMNYPLRGALIGFALGFIDAHQLSSLCKMQQSNYPQPMYRSLMNLLSSHDVERLRTMLSVGGALKHLPRNEQLQAVRALDADQDARGAELQRLVVGLLFALPGMPCIFYGDERGLQGGGDPFCRATFPWDDDAHAARFDCGIDLTSFYQGLGITRKESCALRRGDCACLCAGADIICVARALPEGGEAVFAVANRLSNATTCAFDFASPGSALSPESKLMMNQRGTCEVLFDCASDGSASPGEGLVQPSLDRGILRVHVAACSTVYYRWRKAE